MKVHKGESMKNYERVEVTDNEFRLIKRELMQAGIKFNQGGYTITTTQGDKDGKLYRYVKKNSLIEWVDLFTGEITKLTSSEIARQTLAYYFPKYKGDYFQSEVLKLIKKPVPTYFTEPYKGQAIYFDITACHAQIYAYCTLGERKITRWNRNGSLMEIASSLWEHKQARNSVVGMMRSNSFRHFNGSKIEDKFYKNVWLNPVLWGIISDVLMWIGYKLVKDFDCITWNNDGGLFKVRKGVNPELLAQDLVFSFWRDNWLVDETKVIIGDVDLLAWNCYSIKGYNHKILSDGLEYKNFGKETKLYQSEVKKKVAKIKPLHIINNLGVVEKNEQYYKKAYNEFIKRRGVVEHHKGLLANNIKYAIKPQKHILDEELQARGLDYVNIP